jgi:hypothetical protein
LRYIAAVRISADLQNCDQPRRLTRR